MLKGQIHSQHIDADSIVGNDLFESILYLKAELSYKQELDKERANANLEMVLNYDFEEAKSG